MLHRINVVDEFIYEVELLSFTQCLTRCSSVGLCKSMHCESLPGSCWMDEPRANDTV